jgi:hypothetical protein
MKTKLFLGCAAALAMNASHAVYLNPHGTGEALVYPYYTVNGGNSTLLSLVNTDATGKAVKVRFLEAYDGRDAFDFNVYLSPYDTWVAQVILKNNGAAIFTNDNSCTVPKIATTAAGANVFSTSAFDGTTAQHTDGGPTDISRTLEGSIEIIEMGTVTNGTHGTLDAITHTNGVPNNCEQVVTAWDGYWKTDAQADMSSPTGGLFGSGTILNVARGTVEMYKADAIAQLFTPATPSMHSAVDSSTPNLSSGTSLTSTAFTDDAAVSTPFTRSIDAVSSLFMIETATNEYWTSTSIDAQSEWVVMYPTKRFYTDPQYLPSGTLNAPSPFDSVFGATDGTSCSNADEKVFSREESTTIPSNEAPKPQRPCFSTQVFTFNQGTGQPSKVLGSQLGAAFGSTSGLLAYQNGWANLSFVPTEVGHRLVGTNGNIFYGQPVTGFWVTQFVNGNVDGVLSNYTALSPHKVHVLCDRGDATLPCS